MLMGILNCRLMLILLLQGLLHKNWVLPSRQPEGTKNYKNKALRTPFVESGSSSYLKLEIDDPSIQAIEFIIFDEAQNTWIKNNGQNFHVKLPRKETLISNISLPEDLVQIQAYLRWERKGKQIYTLEKEKGAWQPSLNISTVLTSIRLLLSEPNPDDGLMCEAFEVE